MGYGSRLAKSPVAPLSLCIQGFYKQQLEPWKGPGVMGARAANALVPTALGPLSWVWTSTESG